MYAVLSMDPGGQGIEPVWQGSTSENSETSNQNENPKRKEESKQKTICFNVKSISYI